MRPPMLSVVVPTRDRAEALARCLAALAGQDGAVGEVIVVDDGGRRPARALQPEGLPVRVERQASAGPAAARNRGVAAARGEWVAFLDDDCAPRPGWAAALAAAAGRHPQAALAGVTRNACPGNRWAAASQLLLDEVIVREPGFAPTCNLALPAADLRALGGFDDGYRRAAGEDRDLCRRWAAAGRELRRVDEAVVLHHHDPDAAGFLRQHLRYGRGARRLHGAVGVVRRRRPFVLGLVARAAALRPDLLPHLLLAQAAVAAGYLLEHHGGPAPAPQEVPS